MGRVTFPLVLALGACTARPAVPPDVSQPEWTQCRARLAEVRAREPARPYAERVRLSIRDPQTGHAYEARGAVAVSPARAVRMLLVGPGGSTALDVWVTRDQYRFAVPPIHLEKRGGASLDDAKGLPIGMLRWWFLSPLEGRLLFARSSPASDLAGSPESMFILRDGAATVAVRTDGKRFTAFRREGERVEEMEWRGSGLSPEAGAQARYVDGTLGLRVDVVVEDVSSDEPDPEAFADPDQEGASP
jgi:hypothetical protein